MRTIATVEFRSLDIVLSICVQYWWRISKRGVIHCVPDPDNPLPDEQCETPCILAANELLLQVNPEALGCRGVNDAANILKIPYSDVFNIELHAKYRSKEELARSGGLMFLWAYGYNEALRKVLEELAEK